MYVLQALQGGHGNSETELTDHMTWSWQEADNTDTSDEEVCVHTCMLFPSECLSLWSAGILYSILENPNADHHCSKCYTVALG